MYCLWLGPPNGDLEPEMLKLTSSHICTLIATYLESLAAHNSKPENPRQDTNFGCVWFGFTIKLSTKYCESFHNILRRLTLSLWSKWWLWLRPTSNAALSDVNYSFLRRRVFTANHFFLAVCSLEPWQFRFVGTRHLSAPQLWAETQEIATLNVWQLNHFRKTPPALFGCVQPLHSAANDITWLPSLLKKYC